MFKRIGLRSPEFSILAILLLGRIDPLKVFSCAYSLNNVLIIAENYKEQYSFSLWDLKSDSLIMLASHSEDILSECTGINVFDSHPGKHELFFAVTEKKMMKYWGFNRQELELVHKIHLKDEILDSTVSPLTQFLLFVTKSGKLCIINKEVNINN